MRSLSPPPSTAPACRLVDPDPAAAMVHYTFAAHAGDPVAQMSLGYRHLHGIDVPRSCQTGAPGVARRALGAARGAAACFAQRTAWQRS